MADPYRSPAARDESRGPRWGATPWRKRIVAVLWRVWPDTMRAHRDNRVIDRRLKSLSQRHEQDKELVALLRARLDALQEKVEAETRAVLSPSNTEDR